VPAPEANAGPAPTRSGRAGGLGRFVGAAAAQARAETAEQAQRRQREAARRCELCADPTGEEHAHVVDVQGSRLLCTCRPCAMLFTRPDAAGGRYRTVPDRVLADDTGGPHPGEWDSLQIPVGVAFFLRRSGSDDVDAFYPSPAGATQSLLDLAAWERLRAVCPVIDQAQPDVEAVLIRRGQDVMEIFVVPVDLCYELVGMLRLRWKGFDGGQQARDGLAEFFSRLRARARPYPAPSENAASSGGDDG
jgi:hypothetical protein